MCYNEEESYQKEVRYNCIVIKSCLYAAYHFRLDIAGNNGDSLELPVYDPAPVSQNIEMTR